MYILQNIRNLILKILHPETEIKPNKEKYYEKI